MNNINKGKELENLIKDELSKVVKSPYNLVDNNLRNDQYVNQLLKKHSLSGIYNDKSFIRGDFLIYNSLSEIIMIDAKNYKSKSVVEKTVDVNKALVFLNQNMEYIHELGKNVNKLKNIVYRPSNENGKIEDIGSISKKSFINFINFLENGTIHHHTSEYVNQIKIKKYFIYQVNNQKYTVSSFKELCDKRINISIRNGEDSQRIIFKQNDLLLCEMDSSHHHMILKHHSINMMETKEFSTLKECVKYIEEESSLKTKEVSLENVLKIIEKNEVVSKKSLAIDLMLKNISLQSIKKIYEQVDACKNILSLSEKYIIVE